jgi:hypothetical protein
MTLALLTFSFCCIPTLPSWPRSPLPYYKSQYVAHIFKFKQRLLLLWSASAASSYIPNPPILVLCSSFPCGSLFVVARQSLANISFSLRRFPPDSALHSGTVRSSAPSLSSTESFLILFSFLTPPVVLQ